MIITRLFGGIGNQMFQYAAGRSLAYNHHTQLKLDLSGFDTYRLRQYALSPFNIIENFAQNDDCDRIIVPTKPLKNLFIEIKSKITGIPPLSYKAEPCDYTYDSDFFKSPSDTYLVGYWQSEKYFKDIESVIRKEFTFKKAFDLQNVQLSKKIMGCESVNVHVRRGDYISNRVTFMHHGLCSLEYYRKAIEFIAKKSPDPHFFVFSDDPIWVKENFTINYPHTYVSHNRGISDHADLWLMSLCKHHIIANSSFSWWGAWLCKSKDKIIIAPEKWVNDPTLQIQDLIPESWYRM